MIPTFKYGDKAKYNGFEGTITSIWFDAMGNRNVRITYDDKTLIPDHHEVLESQVKVVLSDNWYDKYYSKNPAIGSAKLYCQKCGEKWKASEHPLFGKKVMWYDCLKCNVKREDYYKE